MMIESAPTDGLVRRHGTSGEGEANRGRARWKVGPVTNQHRGRPLSPGKVGREMMTGGYRHTIRMEIARQGHIGIDPRHVEGYMRLEHSTLDGLSRSQFNKEVGIGIECVMADGERNAEANAKSFGL